MCFLALFLFSCASGNQIVTGTVHEATSPENIELYSEIPGTAEIIAVMSVSNGWKITAQRNVDSSLQKLKKQAAALGANGLFIENLSNEHVSNFLFIWNTRYKINAKALYIQK